VTGSHATWAGWEPRVCWVCSKPVTLQQSSGHSFAERRSWHTRCANGPTKARVPAEDEADVEWPA